MSADLRRSAMGALGWAYTSTAVRIAIQFVSGILLARMLGPEPFGIVAAAWVMVGVASQFVDCGFGSALVQRPQVSEHDIRFAFTLQAIAGVLLSGATALAAGPLARLLGNPPMESVTRLLSFALLLQALGQTAGSLLRRGLDFRTLQLAQLAGTIFGYGAVALPMAKLGYGVKSLVCGQLVQSLVTTAILYAKVRHPLRPLLDIQSRSLVGFGMKATATNLANWAIQGIDSLAMTRFFGPVSTGFFNRAQVLALVPAGQMVQVLQSVLFPAYSRRTSNPVILKQVYLASLASLALVLFPAAAVIALTADAWVGALFGSGWEPAAQFLVPLALAMPAQGAMALNGPLLWAQDRVGDELRVQVVVVVLFAGALVAAGRMTAPAVSWAVMIVYLFRWAAMTRCALKACGATWLEFSQALRGGFCLALLAGATASVVDALAGTFAAGARLALVLLATVPITTAIAAGFSGILLTGETAELLRSCCDRLPLPRWIRSFLQIPNARNAAFGDAL